MSGKHIVILSGAGISAESGLKTFRDSDGLWKGNRVEEVASPQAFERNPNLVHDFYNQRRRQLLTVHPNPAHRAIADLEVATKERRFELSLITQNVDDLHERGGSRSVVHMHGELLRKRCALCGVKSECREDIEAKDTCIDCGESGGLRPDIVWFGETPFFLDTIEQVLKTADTFVAIGTSGVVYPAGGFCDAARRFGAHTIELNLEPTAISANFHETRTGPAAETVPLLVDELMQD